MNSSGCLKINATKVNESKALYPVNPMHSIKAGNVYECVKTFNKLYIPGSSLKGYIISMMWYSILKSNPDIRGIHFCQFKFMEFYKQSY